jgi:hypothetical protein
VLIRLAASGSRVEAYRLSLDYNLAWMILLSAVRLITDRFADYRTARHVKSVALVNQSLQPLAPALAQQSLAQS